MLKNTKILNARFEHLIIVSQHLSNKSREIDPKREEEKNQNSLSSHFQEKELKKYAHHKRCAKCFKAIMRQTYITKELTAQ